MHERRTPVDPTRRLMLAMVALLAVMIGMAPAADAAPVATAEAGEREAGAGGDRVGDRPPRLRIQQDGPMVEIVAPQNRNRRSDQLAFRLISLDTDAVVEGETEPPQIKLVLALGESYELSVRSHHPRRGWSRWTDPVVVTGGVIDAYPFAVQAEAGDGLIRLRWASTDADAYRYEVRDGRGRKAAAATVTGTEAVVDGLRNDRTYHVTVRASYGDRLTPRSPAIPITPNDGEPVSTELRDYVTDPLVGPTRLSVRSAVTGATDRVDRVRVVLAPDGLAGRGLRATFDPSASATTGVDGAWVTRAVVVPPLDHELITTVRGATSGRHRAVLASSLQTWLLGNVDAFAPGANPFTRVGTWR